MAADAYWFDEGTITVNDGTSDTAIAGILGLTVVPQFQSVQQLYTADSVFIESQKQAQYRVQVTLEYTKFDIDAAQEWLSGDGTAGTTEVDTSTPQKFDIKAVSTSTDGSIERTVEVTGVTFDQFPIVDGRLNEYESYNLTGVGERVSQLEDTSS